MSATILSVDSQHPSADVLAEAGRILRDGGLVAFPTETVYGLGADASNPSAVERIFQAKGRPSNNPLIVHIGDVASAKSLTARWPDSADQLAEAFWPGSITIVLPKNKSVPDVVTACGPTVAIRMPAHAVALGLLQRAQRPIAAPSANRSEHVSATSAKHVFDDLGERIELILDGGVTAKGIESTVLELLPEPKILRLGVVSPAQIEAVLHQPCRYATSNGDQAGPAASPGMRSRHYAPSARLEILSDGGRRVEELCRKGLRVGWLTFKSAESSANRKAAIMPRDADAYASALYATLRAFDDWGAEWIIVDRPPEGDGWLAIHDRLRRASASA